jgi:lysophospholipase L1-like esterase
MRLVAVIAALLVAGAGLWFATATDFVDVPGLGGAKAAQVAKAPAPDAARRILAQAARGPLDIERVLARPAEYIQGQDYAPSLIVPEAKAKEAGGYRYDVADPRYFLHLGGALGTGRAAQTVTYDRRTLERRSGQGWGVAFVTEASRFDMLMSTGGQNFTVYVTDLATGVRARAAKDDFVPRTQALSYHVIELGSRAPRKIEVYPGTVAQLYGINVPEPDTIRAAEPVKEPRVAVIWDSYGAGTVSDNGALNNIKLGFPDYFLARLGIANGTNFSIGATGVVATDGGTKSNYQDRLSAGDLDIGRVGKFDLIFVPGSINDGNSNGGSIFNGTVRNAYRDVLQALHTRQPQAIIVGAGPELTVLAKPTQSRFDAYAGGFADAAGTNPQFLYLDNSPAGESWMADPSIIGPDKIHLNRTGAKTLGTRAAESLVKAMQVRYTAP